jgi:hypothetical protein
MFTFKNDKALADLFFRCERGRKGRSMWHACGEVRNAYRVLDGNREGRRPLQRSRLGWENIIKICIKEIGCGLDSAVSGLRPIVGCCEHGNEPSGSIKGGVFID